MAYLIDVKADWDRSILDLGWAVNSMAGVPTRERRGEFETQTQRRKSCGPESGVAHLQAKDHQGLPGATRRWREAT